MKRGWEHVFRMLRRWKPEMTVDRWWGMADPFRKMMGSVLVQNTSWHNACMALGRLTATGIDSPESVLKAPEPVLLEGVRPAGFYRAKSETLRGLARWLNDNGGLDAVKERSASDLRNELLALRGIGPETADVILSYVFDKPTFVADAYTRRIAARFFGGSAPDYEALRSRVIRELPGVKAQQWCHALLVELGKAHCKKRSPSCPGCPLRQTCVYYKRSRVQPGGSQGGSRRHSAR